MDPQRHWRKKQRGLVNSLREACLFRSEVRLVGEAEEVTVVVQRITDDATGAPAELELAEDCGWRDATATLLIEDVDEECQIPVNVTSARTLQVHLDAVTPASWRPRSRWKVRPPQTVGAFNLGRAGGGPAVATLKSLEGNRLTIELEAGSAPAFGDLVRLSPTATSDRARSLRVVEAHGHSVHVELPAIESAGETSTIPHTPVTFQAVIPELGYSIELTTERFTTIGFVAKIAQRGVLLPEMVGAKLSPSGIVCSLRLLDANAGRLEGRISSCDRVAWYNLLSQEALGFDTRLRPGDARAITRLMQESRNYAAPALQERVRLLDGISASYALDTDYPSTRFRWLARHSEGHLVGHLMGIRASERLWSAIDNVGSQSHPGRWNASVVSRWIRAFGELLAGLPGAPLIQWTFNANAGVWTAFYARVRDDSALVHAENRFSKIVLNNLPESPSGSVEVTAIGEPEMLGSLTTNGASSNVARLLEAVCGGCTAPSDFSMAFEREYLKPFRRLHRRLRDERGATYLLTFANHPTWTSLNQGHNFHYLVPLGDAPAPSLPVLQAVREDVLAAGCEPFVVACLGRESELGKTWVDLLLHPSAMGAAAEAAEAF